MDTKNPEALQEGARVWLGNFRTDTPGSLPPKVFEKLTDEHGQEPEAGMPFNEQLGIFHVSPGLVGAFGKVILEQTELQPE